MASLKQYLGGLKLLDAVTLPGAISLLLDGLQVSDTSTPPGSGHVVAGASPALLFLDVALKPGGPLVPFTLATSATGFSLGLDFTAFQPISGVLGFLGSATAKGLIAAEEKSEAATGVNPDGTPHARDVWLEALPAVLPATEPPPPKMTKLGFSIVIDATFGASAALRVSPSPSPTQPAGLGVIGLDPPTVLLGDTGFGLKLGGDMVLDLSTQASTSVPALVDGKLVPVPSTAPGWTGLSVHQARLYLPAKAPLFGKTAADLAFDIGLSPPGISLALATHALARDGIPAMDLRIECVDPTATGLASLAPTLVEAAVTLPIAGDKPLGPDGQGQAGSLTLLAGTPVVARARFSRDPTAVDGLTRLAVALEAQGPDGILAVRPKDANDKLALALVGAAGLATALIADDQLTGGGDGSGHGGTMAALLVAGEVLADLLSAKGALVVNRIELSSAGHGLPVGEPLMFLVDYSVDVPIKPIDIGVLNVALQDDQLLRIRMRGVSLSYNPKKQGLSAIDLDFRHATMDVEDPGRWQVSGPNNLFDVLGTRSGKGSIWLEIDLRFKLDLGPIKVSGATLRATLANKQVSVSLRGLDASLSIPGLVTAEGKIAIDAPADAAHPNTGFSARLAAKILPLGAAADAWVTVAKPMVLVGLAVDLPGPIPLGPTGLGLYGIEGMVGISAAIALPPADGPVASQLAWKADATGFAPAPGQFTFGAMVSIGTLPDLAFNFSAKAGLFVTVPDLAVLGSLDARFMAGPVSLVDPATYAGNGVRGTVSVLPSTGAQFAIQGTFGVPALVSATVPVAGAFPPSPNQDHWYVYVGSDGVASGGPGRGIGPVRMTVLPGLFLSETADAYLMLRGNGIDQWRGGVTVDKGFVIVFGFHKEMHFGVKPLAWAEVGGGVDVLVATSPLVIAGVGRLDGNLHIGPVSLGVSAQITVCLTDNATFVLAELCGRVHLLFVTFHRCAKLSFGGMVTPTIMPPVQSPIDRVTQNAQGQRIVVGQDVSLIDDRYRRVHDLSTKAADVPPTVWPDTLIRIGFAWPPALADKALDPFVPTFPEGTLAAPIGSEFLRYDWTLTSLQLVDETTGQPIGGGQLAATWQVGKAGDASTVAQPAELVLLTPQGDLWIDRVADPAGTPPAGPGAAAVTCCQAVVVAKPGWALAASIVKIMQPTWLPPEFVSADPTQSRVSGNIGWTMDGADGNQVAMEALFAALPPGISFVPPVPFKVPETLGGRTFAGLVSLPFLKRNAAATAVSPPSLPRYFTATIVLTNLLTSLASGGQAAPHNVLVAMCLDAITPERLARDPFRVWDESGVDWDVSYAPLPSGQLGLVYTMPAGRKAARVVLHWRSDGHFGLLGLGGVTDKAATAAQAKQAGLAAQADKNKQGGGTDPGAVVNDKAQRCLLQPGRRYRIDLRMSWKGTRYAPGDNGQKEKAVDTQAGDWPLQQFWFQTAPDPYAPGGTMTTIEIPKPGLGKDLQALYVEQASFTPEMLVRHLTAYEPAQSVVDRFRNDPLCVHFDVGHVVRLAKLYGYDLALALRRTDVGGVGGALQFPGWKLGRPMTDTFLKGAALAHFRQAAQSPCPIPVEGAVMTVPVQLEPRAWYETYVQATHSGTAGPRVLPGVTFRTSRWTDAADMLGALAFPVAGVGARTGDLALTGPIAGLKPGRSDTAFDAALVALGLAGWPVPAEPRTSLLWQPLGAASWACVGLLLESPEPIERPGRTGPATLAAQLAPGQPAVAFAKVTDRTGSRLLWVTSTPFKPISWFSGAPGPIQQHAPRLALSLADTPVGQSAGKPSAVLVGLLALPIAPLFAGEAF